MDNAVYFFHLLAVLVIFLAGRVQSKPEYNLDEDYPEEVFSAPSGQCQKEGSIGDPKDSQKFYSCVSKFDLTGKPYLIWEVNICPNGTVWNEDKLHGQCESVTADRDYKCLKDSLETDASRLCFKDTLSILERSVETFVEAAAYRGDPARNFHLSVRDIHLTTRKNYAKLIENTGKNIYPLIVATDSDTPELAGVGGVFKIYFRNGTMRRIVPVGPAFELHKCLSHIILGLFAIVGPFFKAPMSLNWQPLLKDFNQRITEALYVLPNSGLSSKDQKHVEAMLTMTESYISKSLKNNSVPLEEFRKFANEFAPYIEKSMKKSAKAHVAATIPALEELKKDMGPVEWRKTYAVIPTVWPVALYNIRLQMLQMVMDFKQVKEQVLITEGARTEDDARTTLGRIVADRALAQLAFGGMPEDSMKDHVFSLSTRRDLLSTPVEEAVTKYCQSKKDPVVQNGDESKPNKCPLSRIYATMLRQNS